MRVLLALALSALLAAPAPAPIPGPLPVRLRPIMLRATKTVKVPASWVQSPGLYQVLKRESGFNPRARNRSSGALGLFQFLPSTWRTVGGRPTTNAYLQCVYGLRYIKARYRTPARAWSFWRSHGWY